MPEKQCFIFWKSKITGKTGNGNMIPLRLGKLWIEQERKRSPESEHWLISTEEMAEQRNRQ